MNVGVASRAAVARGGSASQGGAATVQVRAPDSARSAPRARRSAGSSAAHYLASLARLKCLGTGHCVTPWPVP